MKQLTVTSAGRLALMEAERPSLEGKPPGAIVRVTHALVGVGSTIEEIIARRAHPDPQAADITVAYQVAGIVRKVTPGLAGFAPGDAVCVAGMGVAYSAEEIYAPVHMMARLKGEDDLEAGAFCNVACTALHGTRRARSALGEWNVVAGLGLVGLFAVQFARLSGGRVVGTDVVPRRIAAGLALGAEHVFNPREIDAAAEIVHLTDGGADAVLATARSADPAFFSQLNRMMNPLTGRIVMIGVFPVERPVGADVEVLMCGGGGPGWRDPAYKLEGAEYPRAYVRWTAGRNLQLFADLVGQGKLETAPLITHRFPISAADDAYSLIIDSPEEALGVMLEF